MPGGRVAVRERERGEGEEGLGGAAVAGEGVEVGEGERVQDQDLAGAESNQQLRRVAVQGTDLALWEAGREGGREDLTQKEADT